MSATSDATARATDATPAQIDFSILDDVCAAAGATNESARAELLDVDRSTLWRWRAGKQQPRLDVVARIANRFGVTVDELIKRAA